MPSGYEGGRREKLADFVGFTSTNSSKTRRPDALTFDYLTAFCPGPVANGDVSQGVVPFAWRCRVENPSAFDFTGRVYISRENDTHDGWEPEVELFTFTGDRIDEVDIAFEQAGRPVVCAERSGHVWLYWFNTVSSAFEFTDFGIGRTPRVILDNPLNTSDSDVLLFYLSVTKLVLLQQRDRYTVEIETPFGVDDSYFIEDVVKMRDSRIRVLLSRRDSTTGKYSSSFIDSTLYPVVVIEEGFTPNVSFLDASLVSVIIDSALDVDAFSPGLSFTSATLLLPVISETLYDTDNFAPNFSFISATLILPVITHVLYDKDSFGPALSFVSATLVVVVISNTLFDKDSFAPNISFSSATLETV